ncbi:MAG: hypothetical protein ACSHYF_00980 [Verrucomicrobiaceae bacterium]
MDKELIELESRLSELTPRGLSDEGLSRCEAQIDDLSRVATGGSHSLIGVPWRIMGAAAAIMLGVGIFSGWWLGHEEGGSVAGSQSQGADFFPPAFEVLGERSWSQVDPESQIFVSDSGEVLERRTEVDVSEETVLHRDSGKLVTVRVTTRQPVDIATDQF